MVHLQSPNELTTSNQATLFLAGGISNCPDWQASVVQKLEQTEWCIFNPRRENFDFSNPTVAREQIVWEHKHLRLASAIAFWFPPDTLCPITLYELGAWSMTSKPLFVGVAPNYARKTDVEIQTALSRPDVVVVYSLEALVEQLKRQI